MSRFLLPSAAFTTLVGGCALLFNKLGYGETPISSLSSSASSSSWSSSSFASTTHHQTNKSETRGTSWPEFTTCTAVREFVQRHNNFVKEVDTCTGSGDGVPKLSTTTSAVPETQLQVWRLGTDSKTFDFPEMTRQQMLEQHEFPLQQDVLAPSPVLRLIVLIPNATTRRVISEVTDPCRRTMWDANYREFVVMNDFRNTKKKTTTKSQAKDLHAEEYDTKWAKLTASQEQQQERNLKERGIKSHDPAVQSLLASSDYQAMLTQRMRPGFALDYARWTFHRVYSAMTAAFGMKPRISFVERVYGELPVVVSQRKTDFIRTAIDVSLALPPELPEAERVKKQAEFREEGGSAVAGAPGTPSSAILTKADLHSAAHRVARAGGIPVPEDVPVFCHLQELLLFPLPRGVTDKQIAELMVEAGKEDMSSSILQWYEKQWLPTVHDGKQQEADAPGTRLDRDAVLMSFTTANSTGIVGYPRWFERYVQKHFSVTAMSALIAQVNNTDI